MHGYRRNQLSRKGNHPSNIFSRGTPGGIEAPQTTRILVTSLQHPTLFFSEIDNLNILPYSQGANVLLTSLETTPRTFKATLSSNDSELWQMAIDKELEAMTTLWLWDVTELEENHKLRGTTWVFTMKQKHLNGNRQYKAHLCAQGLTQGPGIYYEQIYAPTGILNSLKTLIAFSAANNLQFHQLDVKRAFLNTPLTKDIYLSIPQGISICQCSHSLKQKKGIYGLRKAPLAWYECLKEWPTSLGFQVCILDPCGFFRSDEPPTWLYLLVDRIEVFRKDVCEFQKEVSQKFDIKDLEEASLMLGIKITCYRESITLDQLHLTESLLDKYEITDFRPTSTPLITNEHLIPATSKEVTKLKSLKINLRSAVGSINYLSSTTQPHLSFTVSTLSQYLECPGIQHWDAFLHVLCNTLNKLTCAVETVTELPV
ncbi:hypothetical protein O181_018197 [Austropuccinia psidii MF-1]|uniref:Reverse transcriptase Ty1/copia-type domain-containing protein n=1 Tax=Austropuccinia psidii MF-1 TaxID=1389203 RepID=A0A9Q3GTA1_9BASI|nr:hypothetical protein [Austropuccinia psidii MF-1]